MQPASEPKRELNEGATDPESVHESVRAREIERERESARHAAMFGRACGMGRLPLLLLLLPLLTRPGADAAPNEKEAALDPLWLRFSPTAEPLRRTTLALMCSRHVAVEAAACSPALETAAAELATSLSALLAVNFTRGVGPCRQAGEGDSHQGATATASASGASACTGGVVVEVAPNAEAELGGEGFRITLDPGPGNPQHGPQTRQGPGAGLGPGAGRGPWQQQRRVRLTGATASGVLYGVYRLLARLQQGRPLRNTTSVPASSRRNEQYRH